MFHFFDLLHLPFSSMVTQSDLISFSSLSPILLVQHPCQVGWTLKLSGFGRQAEQQIAFCIQYQRIYCQLPASSNMFFNYMLAPTLSAKNINNVTHDPVVVARACTNLEPHQIFLLPNTYIIFNVSLLYVFLPLHLQISMSLL